MQNPVTAESTLFVTKNEKKVVSQRRTVRPMENSLSMNRPHLVILVEAGRIPLKGGCSSCKDVHFTAGIDHIGTAQEQHSKLESLFLEHFRKVHMHEDASRKATNA